MRREIHVAGTTKFLFFNDLKGEFNKRLSTAWTLSNNNMLLFAQEENMVEYLELRALRQYYTEEVVSVPLINRLSSQRLFADLNVRGKQYAWIQLKGTFFGKDTLLSESDQRPPTPSQNSFSISVAYPNFSIPDPVSKRFQIPYRDPHQRIKYY